MQRDKVSENETTNLEIPMGDPAPQPISNTNGPLTAAKAAALVDKVVS